MSENERAIELSKQAHTAELEGRIPDAVMLHHDAAELLVTVVAKGKKKTEERRRAKLHQAAAKVRWETLRAADYWEARELPPPLPSLATFQGEVNNPGDIVLLSLVELGQRQSLPPPSQLEEGQDSQFFTPRLSTSLPDVTYYVYCEKIGRYPNLWVNMHIKDGEKDQILYTISAFKRPKEQIPKCIMARASEYYSICADIVVKPVVHRPGGNTSAGRQFTINATTGTSVVIAPDCEEKGWNPRRFTYGGLRFVWKDDPKIKGLSQLFEVKREWPEPESKTGKTADETFERCLCWGDAKLAAETKVSTIHMVGGMDQLFREFLLSNLVAQAIIEDYEELNEGGVFRP